MFILLQEARVLFILQDCVVMLSLTTLLDYWHFCNSLHHYEETDVNGENLELNMSPNVLWNYFILFPQSTPSMVF